MHFASFIQVGESVQHPDKYYQNNVVNTLALIDEMRAQGVRKFIFSSTAASHQQQPLSVNLNTRQ
jgi:UDP-glucose 4-epimerase